MKPGLLRRPGLFSVLAITALIPASARAGADAVPRDADPPAPASFALAAVTAAATELVERTARDITASPRLRGVSGSVAAVVLAPGEPLPLEFELPERVRIQFVAAADAAPADTVDGTPTEAGAWRVLVRLGDIVRRVEGVHVFTSLPLTEKRAGRIGPYLIGDWPFEKDGRPASSAYAPPAGLVAVTPAIADLPVSAHLRLRDLLTKGQSEVWPKYVALNPRVLDKVELTVDELRTAGVDVGRVGVVSGFRTPWYNANGGSTGGRGNLSRHMYGDAVDFYVDNDGNGTMDDLDGDGRVDRRDATVIARAAERVERAYPHLVGGIGIYDPRPGAHAGFVHIDARGAAARW